MADKGNYLKWMNLKNVNDYLISKVKKKKSYI